MPTPGPSSRRCCSRCASASSSPAGEEEAAAERAAARPGDGHFGPARDLAVAALAPQLHARLVEKAVAVEAARRQLAAVGVDRDLAVPGYAPTALDERPAFTLLAEAERLEPGQRDEAEAVVELGHVDIGGREVGPLPQH